MNQARTEIDVYSHGTRLGAYHYRAEHENLATEAGRPCVVMGHGFGAGRDDGLDPFATAFAAAGCDVVVFDYRGFGSSDGQPRQNIDHRRHREDYVAVVRHVRSMTDIDPDRVVLWGSSYSGGHVVAVAAHDSRVAGVISQGPAMDGLKAVLQILSYAGPGQLLKLTGHSLRDYAAKALRRTPHTIPIVGPPGALAAITSEDGESGYGLIMGPAFRNEMLARGVLPIMFNRPVRHAPKMTAPLLLIIAANDSIAPTSAVYKVAETAGGPVTTKTFDVGHFDIYADETFAESITEQVSFLTDCVARQPAREGTS